MPRSKVSLVVLLAAAAAPLAGSMPTAQAEQPHRAQAVGRIESARVKPGPLGSWYSPSNHAFVLDVGGTTGAACGVRATWTRREDGHKAVVDMGAATLPSELGTQFPGPFGLMPGTWDIVVDGGAQTTSLGTFAACEGARGIGPLIVDENTLGQTFPKIVDAKWEGDTTGGGTIGVFKTGGPDKYLDVVIANYLEGSKWTTIGPLNQGAVCGISITLGQQGGSGGFSDPFPLVLPNAAGGTDVYRGQVVTPGPWGARFHANITRSLAQYYPIMKGTTYTVVVHSTPINNSVGAAPCIGSISTLLRAE